MAKAKTFDLEALIEQKNGQDIPNATRVYHVPRSQAADLARTLHPKVEADPMWFVDVDKSEDQPHVLMMCRRAQEKGSPNANFTIFLSGTVTIVHEGPFVDVFGSPTDDLGMLPGKAN